MGRTKDSVRHRLKWLKDKETPQEEKKSPVAAKSVKKKEAHKEKEIRPTRTKEPHVSYPPLEWCPTCHSPRRPHRVCPVCGTYAGREIVSQGHDHEHDHDRPAVPVTTEDTGSQALSVALQSSFSIVRWIMAALVIVFLCSGLFNVGPQERVVILRFGKPLGDGSKALLGPGFHWSFPPPIDELVRIPITQIQKVISTTGWYFTTPEMEFNNQEPQAQQPLNPAVLEAARQLLDRTRLRWPQTLQLATALAARDMFQGTPIIVVSVSAPILEAARAEGFKTLDPAHEPAEMVPAAE